MQTENGQAENKEEIQANISSSLSTVASLPNLKVAKALASNYNQNLPNILSIAQFTGVADTLVHVQTPSP